ncbi:MAG: dihydroorotate dehydrogenase electron transfer subunit [Lachnospiraceae bacterium]|nr:dihydroorotate dehydrogenase electron transfer subunit [Lachnospiraceae bacterium]
MRKEIFTILENERIAENGIYKMVLSGDASDCMTPGTFVNILVRDNFLRRPISVCDASEHALTLIYKTVGKGTAEMSMMLPGEKLSILTGLGNGFNTGKAGDRPLLIGGGVGVPPMYALCKKLVSEGREPVAVLGFNTADDAFYIDEFREAGAEVYVSTVDGSIGEKGFVTDIVKKLDYSFFYTCGPGPMFRALKDVVKTEGQYSFEARMGCGFGACMGCSMMTKNGSKRVCREGPVFESGEIIWED